ncbi:hypothetical protein Q4R94_22420, partial [Morganella morganii]
MGFQVRVDDGGVEFFAGADASGLVGQRHGVPFSCATAEPREPVRASGCAMMVTGDNWLI